MSWKWESILCPSSHGGDWARLLTVMQGGRVTDNRYKLKKVQIGYKEKFHLMAAVSSPNLLEGFKPYLDQGTRSLVWPHTWPCFGQGVKYRPPWHVFQAQISCASTSDKNYASVRNMQKAPSLMRKGSGQLGVVRARTSEEAGMLYGKSWVSSQKLGNPVSVVFQQQKMDDKSA